MYHGQLTSKHTPGARAECALASLYPRYNDKTVYLQIHLRVYVCVGVYLSELTVCVSAGPIRIRTYNTCSAMGRHRVCK